MPALEAISYGTWRDHQELAGGVFADVIVDEAHNPVSDCPWKGNIDLSKLKQLVDEHGAENMAGVLRFISPYSLTQRPWPRMH